MQLKLGRLHIFGIENFFGLRFIGKDSAGQVEKVSVLALICDSIQLLSGVFLRLAHAVRDIGKRWRKRICNAFGHICTFAEPIICQLVEHTHDGFNDFLAVSVYCHNAAERYGAYQKKNCDNTLQQLYVAIELRRMALLTDQFAHLSVEFPGELVLRYLRRQCLG